MVSINNKNAKLASRLTEEQRLELDKPIASANGDCMGLAYASTLERTRVFHKAVHLPVAQKIVLNPSVSLRLLRAALILEEYNELLKALGLVLTIDGRPFNEAHETIGLAHVEGSQYDVVEASDAFGDLDVVVNGGMLSLGIPSNEVGYEIYCSNMTKLDEEGEPIVNQCQYPGDENCKFSIMDMDGPCIESAHYQRPDLPYGKVLKPDHYVKANLSAVLLGLASIYGTEEN